MITLSLIVLVAIATIAGYWVGTRRRAWDAATKEPAAACAPAPDPSAAQATEERSETDRVGSEKARIIRSRDNEADSLRRSLADCQAAVLQLEQLARERRWLFRELAEARGDTARYRQLAIDIETNAPPRILAGSGEPDDLKLIVGVGPVLERMLHSLGVATFRQIARWTARDVAEFDTKLPEFPGRIVRDQWVTQARALHRSKYGEQV